MKAVLDHDRGLRTGRVVCQVVLMEITRDRRRFLLADTGISIQPSVEERADILGSTVDVAEALWATSPKVALMAATETIKPSMPETVEAAEMVRRNKIGELANCLVEGPLSFDLAYAADAAAKKHVDGSVVGTPISCSFPTCCQPTLPSRRSCTRPTASLEAFCGARPHLSFSCLAPIRPKPGSTHLPWPFVSWTISQNAKVNIAESGSARTGA